MLRGGFGPRTVPRLSKAGELIGSNTQTEEAMSDNDIQKYRVEVLSGVNKGRIMDVPADKAEQFVAEHKVRILHIITADAPPEATPNFLELQTEVSGSIEPAQLTPESAGDELENEERCVALTAKGERCKNARKDDCEQCSTHAPKIIEAQASLVLNKE
jgi:hypothetical protein